MIKLGKLIPEGKYDYTVYHNSYSSAVQAAEKYAERRGYTVDEDDWWNKVATGPKKPSEGKTNSFVIDLMKNGKPNHSTLAMQIYGRGNGKYELNCYINVSKRKVK